MTAARKHDPKRPRPEAEGPEPAPERPEPDPAAPELETVPETEPAPEDPELTLLKQKAAERDAFLERMQRMKAETQNFKNRLTKDFETQREYAVQQLVADLLPVLDNLDRAIEAAENQTDDGGMLDGVKLVRQQALGVLANHGVEPILAAGEPFDPAEHEAVMQMPSDSQPAGTVVHEVQKGYRMRDRVVRPSKVVVAAPPAEDQSNQE